MGMFDSVYAPLKCPNCGDDGEKELQTKDLDCYMHSYRIGDSIGTTQFRWLYCLACCQSDTCKKERDKALGYRSGLGGLWDVFAEISDDGRITGRFETEIPPAKPSKEQI